MSKKDYTADWKAEEAQVFIEILEEHGIPVDRIALKEVLASEDPEASLNEAEAAVISGYYAEHADALRP